jgi:spore germination cell wall hydrolase CwlJ-like protein
MKRALAAAALGGVLLFAVQARGGSDATPAVPARGPALSWTDWSAGLRAGAPPRAAEAQAARAEEIDVVDAHWMALTMWGEARSSGEEGMRAVGHVIANRRLSGRHGAFATDTVSEAWQFSCWNAGDPNLRAMQNVETLPHDGREYRMWQAAKRVAGEILAGQSEDPTGGALFYHADYVAPRWAEGVPAVTRIGRHLFYLSAR